MTRLHEETKVDKLCITQQFAGCRDDAKSRSEHSHVKCQVTGELDILTADDDFSRTSTSHSSNRAKQQTVKPESTCDDRVSKKDVADIVIRQLTPYYKSRRFGSKVHFCNQLYQFLAESVAS